MFTSQLYRVLKSPTLWLGSLVYVAAMLYMGISSCLTEYDMGFAAAGYAWLDVLVAGTSYMASFITAFLPPLLCVLSGAGLVRQDVDCGLYKYAVMRAGHMKYLWAKLGAAVTGAFIFCLVSYGATLAIAYIAFPGYAAMPGFTMKHYGQEHKRQTEKRAADNKLRLNTKHRKSARCSACFVVRGFQRGFPFGTRLCSQSVVCYTLCRRCCENVIANREGKHILSSRKTGL